MRIGIRRTTWCPASRSGIEIDPVSTQIQNVRVLLTDFEVKGRSGRHQALIFRKPGLTVGALIMPGNSETFGHAFLRKTLAFLPRQYQGKSS